MLTIFQACEIISSDPFELGETVGLDCTDGTTKIKILDVNDNPPRFNWAAYTYSIPEDMRNGENLDNPVIEIKDLDSVSHIMLFNSPLS